VVQHGERPLAGVLANGESGIMLRSPAITAAGELTLAGKATAGPDLVSRYKPGRHLV
jgi:hypothetical protein